MNIEAEISLLNLNDIIEVREFVNIKNKAYEHRGCESMPFIKRSEIELYQKIQTGFCVKAIVNGRIVGGAGCMYTQKDSLLTGEIFWVFVDPDFNRMGIADKLMSSIENKANRDGVKLLNLFVYAEATPAIKLYKKAGFKILKVIPTDIGRSLRYEYIKPLASHKYRKFTRLYKLYYSKVKCTLLFNKKNNPTLIYKILYR